MRKFTKILLISLASLLLLLILVLSFGPALGKNYVVKNSKELLGRKIELSELSINYFTTTISLVQFTMYESDDSLNFISFDTLKIDLEPLNLLHNEFVLEEFFLKGFYAQVEQQDSLFNFDDLLAFYASEDTLSEPEDTTYKPFIYHLHNIHFEDITFKYTDKTIQNTTQLEHLSLSLPYIGLDPNKLSKGSVQFSLGGKSALVASLDLNPINGDFMSELKIRNLQLSDFNSYVQYYLPKVDSLVGNMNSNFTFKGNYNQIEKMIIDGDADLESFKMTDKNRKPVLAADKIHCKFKQLDSYNSKYILDTLRISTPYVFFKLSEKTDNISELFGSKSETTDSSAAASSLTQSEEPATEDSLFYSVGHFELNTGIMDYTDNLTGDNFNYHLSSIELKVDDIKSTSDWIEAYSTMLLNHRGNLVAKLGVDPLNPMNLNLNLSIEKFKLSDLNLYSNFYMGHNIVKGNMFYYSQTSIKNGIINSKNRIVIRNARVEGKEKGLGKLPLKFALFILKDKDGVIDIDLPVSGDLNDPDLSLGKLVWNIFKDLIVKVATSPARLLSNLIGGSPEEIEQIKFAFSDTTLTSQQQLTLRKLIDLKTKKDGLGINLIYYCDPKLQKTEIAHQLMEQGFTVHSGGKSASFHSGEYETFVRSHRGGITAPEMDEAVRIAVGDQILDSLNRLYDTKRIFKVEQYIDFESDQSGIKVKRMNAADPLHVGTNPILKVEFYEID